MDARFFDTFAKWVNAEVLQFYYNWQRIEPGGYPVVFQIELTNHCPMTCEMCPRTNQMTRPLGFMEFDVFKKIIDEARYSTRSVLLHHFGDSLLHPDIARILNYASQSGVKGFLSANPILLTDHRIASLVDSGLEELVLSLDGVTAATNERVRGRAAGNLELAESRLRKLLDYKAEAGRSRPRVILQIVEQGENRHEVNDWLRKWKNWPGIDRVKVKRYVAWDNTNERIKSLRVHEIQPPDFVCDKPWTSLTVLWDGRVVPCCFDYDGKQVLGNVNNQSLREIWNSENLRRFRGAHASHSLSGIPLCAKCVDKEGYPTRKLYYPLNRIISSRNPLGEERAE